MLYEQCFARLPRVRALDLLDDWRPAYGEWLGAQVGAGFDRTTTARLMEAADIAVAEADAGESDAAWMLRRAAADMGDGTWEALTAALDFVNAKGAGAPHTHAMTEADWKASPWYRKEIPFRPDMTETRARIMAENFDHRRYRDALIARGAEVYNGVGDMALGFGAMLLGGVPDPVNLLSLGGGMVAASRAATLGGAMRAGAKAGAAEGALFTAVADAIVLPDLATRGEDVEFADFALDTIAGALLGGVFRVEPVQNIQHPAPERLGDRSTAEHGDKVAAAQGEDAGLRRNCRGHQIDDHAHIMRKFFPIPLIDIGHGFFRSIPQRAGQFGGAYPKAVLVGDGRKGDVVESERCLHGYSVRTFQGSQGIFPNRKCRVLKTAHGTAPRL